MSAFTEDLIDHRRRVARYMRIVADDLLERAVVHDNSKLSPEEFALYEEAFSGLQKYAYGSEEFKAEFAKIAPALAHHYQVNDHHPEHFENGVIGMNLVQLIEMTCDWMAASERSQTNIYQGVEMNRKRFAIEPQLITIIAQTIALLQRG